MVRAPCQPVWNGATRGDRGLMGCAAGGRLLNCSCYCPAAVVSWDASVLRARTVLLQPPSASPRQDRLVGAGRRSRWRRRPSRGRTWYPRRRTRACWSCCARRHGPPCRAWAAMPCMGPPAVHGRPCHAGCRAAQRESSRCACAAGSAAQSGAGGRCRDGGSRSGVARLAVGVVAPTCVCCMSLHGMCDS